MHFAILLSAFRWSQKHENESKKKKNFFFKKKCILLDFVVFGLFKPGSPVLKMILYLKSIYVTNELINSNFSDNAVCLEM